MKPSGFLCNCIERDVKPMKITKSIQWKLWVPTCMAFFAIIIFINLLVFRDTKMIISRVLEELRISVVQLVETELDKHLDQALMLNETNRSMLEGGYLDVTIPRNREIYFSSMIKNYPDVVMTYFGMPTGEFYGARRVLDQTIEVVKNNTITKGKSEYYSIKEDGTADDLKQVFENYDPRIRPWYQAAVEKRQSTFSGIYSHFIFHEPTITASLPIYEGDTLIGVFGVDFLMTWLGDILQKLPIGENGQIFIVDEKHQLVATTTDENLFHVVDNQSVNIFVTESENPITKKAYAQMEVTDGMKEELEENAFFIDTFFYQNQRYYFSIDRYQREGMEWYLYTVLKEDDFMSNSNRAIVFALFVVFFIAILFVILLFFITKRITAPIVKLKESAKQLSLGIYSKVPVTNEDHEINQLAESFNDMGATISKLLHHLEEEVRLRTLELEEKNQILEELTYVDALSKISNRRKFNEYFSQLMDQSNQTVKQCGLIMMDIDFFKNYNDRYGHLEGDVCIERMGDVLKRVISEHSDIIARYGGEEFISVLINRELSEMIEIVKQIQLEVENLSILHEGSVHGYVSLSFGVLAVENKNLYTAEELLKLVDICLYSAKEQGRNRMVSRQI